MQALGYQPFAEPKIHDLASAPHTHSYASADLTRCRSVSTYCWKNSECLSGPAKFKPALFKGQLYFLSKTYPYQQLPGTSVC